MKNIILLTIDALRADHLSGYGYGRKTTPFLDQFADGSTVFVNAYSASSHTREAIPALLTGLHPTEAVDDGFRQGDETIPMILPDTYTKGGFHSNPYVSRAYGFQKGFDHFDDDLRLGQNKILALFQRVLDKFIFNRGEYHARAEEINSRSLAWIDSLNDNRPFFLWNHYMDTHGPYNPPDGYANWSENVTSFESQQLYNTLTGDTPTASETKLSLNLYDGEIRYVDDHINKFIKSLDQRGLLEESIIIITSDHGDLFGEYGKYAHPRYVFTELTHVPLFISGPGITADTVEEPVSTLDVLPTILDAIGESISSLPGESLLDLDQLYSERPVFSSVASEDSEHNIRRFSVQTQNIGYRFTRNQDTGKILDETFVDIGRQDTDKANNNEAENNLGEELKETLLEHSNRIQSIDSAANSQTEPNSEIEERLEALGYK